MRILLLMVLGVWLMNGDTLPPSLVWTENVVPPDSTDGISQGVGCGEAPTGCDLMATFDRTFTVISPGLFSFSTFDDLGVMTFNCSPAQCFSSAVAAGAFTDTDQIIGPVSYSQVVSDSGMNTQNCEGSPEGNSALLCLVKLE